MDSEPAVPAGSGAFLKSLASAKQSRYYVTFVTLLALYLDEVIFRRMLFLRRPAFVRLRLVSDGLPVYLAAEDEGRTEQPTDRRRRKEREKGRVAKSPEIPAGLVSIGSVLMLFLLSGFVMRGLAEMMQFYLSNFAWVTSIDADAMVRLLGGIVQRTGMLLAPIFGVAMLMAVIGNVVQAGFLFSLEPLKPDFSRIKLTPDAIIKRVFFSRQILVNLVKAILKTILLGLVCWYTIESDMAVLMKSTDLSIADSIRLIGDLSFKLSIVAGIILLVMAVFDYLFQRSEFTESLKMTKQEVKEEYKETEGDPLVRQRQRQRAVEFLRRNIAAGVKRSDVVITNPTHYAVALRYDPAQENAPRVMAKGEDQLALNIRNLARNWDIPIVENKPLARELFKVKEGELAPPELYGALVPIIREILRLKNRKVG